MLRLQLELHGRQSTDWSRVRGPMIGAATAGLVSSQARASTPGSVPIS